MHRSRTFLLLLPFCVALSGTVHAASAEPASKPAATAEDPEEQIDDGLKRFGYLTGLALGCVEQSQRTKLEREAMDLNVEIVRTLGSDRAFLFSAAFGYGSNIELKVSECKTVLERYDARVDKFRKGQRGSR